jgi:hypothetical protein
MTLSRATTIALALACAGLVADGVGGQGRPDRQPALIPPGATSLEGIPTVRIDSTEGSTIGRILDAAEAAKAKLKVKVIDGQYFWATRGDRALRLNTTGEFTYLTSDPGNYIRLMRLNDRISYVEHVDVTSGSVTWFGELKIVVRD